MISASRSTAAGPSAALCNVTGSDPSLGKSNIVAPAVRFAGSPRSVRTVTPNPALAAAHNPATLALTTAMRHSSPETKRRYQLGLIHQVRMKKPIKDAIRYIFVTVASLRKSRKLRRCVTS